MVFQPPSLIEPGVRSPTLIGGGAAGAGGLGASSRPQAMRDTAVSTNIACFICRDCIRLPLTEIGARRCCHPERSEGPGWEVARRRIMAPPLTQVPRYAGDDTVNAERPSVIHRREQSGGHSMDEIERDDGDDYEDEHIEQMIIDNGILLHSLAALLVRKGILKQEEIDGEMDRLYEEMENFEQQ